MARAFSPDLDALAELAASFARAYPALAPHLAERSSDPDVERLLDAFAYLTERVHELLDAGSPTSAQVFSELLTPELSRPFPCATVLEIAAPSRGRLFVPQGAEFESVPVDGSCCRFRACSAFELVPWSVDDARIAWSVSEGQSLDVTLRASSDGGAGQDLRGSLFPLRLHFTGDSRAASTLLLFLREHLTDVELRIGGPGGATRSLGKAVRPWGLLAEEALLPPEPCEHPGLRMLREYFVLPSKFAFVELGAVDPTVLDDLPSAASVELRFRFDVQFPQTMLVTKENVRINCVPVANVFETTTDPVLPTLERPSHLLRPAGLPLGHGETYSVTRVLARVEGRAGVTPISAFSEFEASPPEALAGVFYVARPVPGKFGKGNEVQLSLGSHACGAPVPPIEFLSVEIRGCNGTLPDALGVGDVRIPTETSPRGLGFRNVSAVTPYRPPAMGDELRWRTLATIALSALSLTNASTLQTLLHVLNLHPLSDAQAERADRQRMEAIASVSVRPSKARQSSPGPHQERAPGGALPVTHLVGHDVDVEISNTGFDGEGDALIFASVLSCLFGHEASLGTFARTTVRVLETGRTFVFPARHADRTFEPTPGWS